MNISRIVDPDSTRPLHVVLVCLVAATVAGSCLLTNGPNRLLEGAEDWREESPLRAVVHVLNLNYTQTTAQGVEIKSLVFGIGAALAAAALGLAWTVRSPAQEEADRTDTIIVAQEGQVARPVSLVRRQIPPLAAAWVLMGLYAVWSFGSATWSSAPDLAVGGSIVLSVGVIWALALGLGLNRPTAAVGGGLLVIVGALTAALAIAYFGERNPTRRASYPLGNPLFLAACLIPGIILGLALLGASVRSAAKRMAPLPVVVGVLSLSAAVVMLWAVHLTGSRSAVAALLCGVAAMVFFLGGRRLRIAIAVAAVVVCVVGIRFYIWPAFSAPSTTGRDASLRVRAYGWNYAMELAESAAVLGHGQGGFTRFGDALAVKDVFDDPQALEFRLAHAHNEWLEIWADLGIVGLMLAVGAIAATLWAGALAVPRISNVYWRWVLAGLLASLAALVVEECADVGLRIAGLPTVFYSVIGLAWALSHEPAPTEMGWMARRRPLSRAAGVGAIVAAAGLMFAAITDFEAARAESEVAEALQRREFDAALRFADLASRGRLSPQRKLESYEGRCAAQLYVAREFQTSAVARYQKALAADPPDDRLLLLAGEDRRQAETHIEAARQAWKALYECAPNYYGLGWLEFRLYQLAGVFADLDGDAANVEDKRRGALEALTRELRRRPFDSFAALSYVELAADDVSIEERMAMIAQPLRHTAIPSEYGPYLWELASRPGFDAQFSAMSPEAARVTADPTQSGDTFLPEKLRLAANVHFLRDEYDAAVRKARAALLRYDWIVRHRPTVGQAACHFELADYQFFSDPANWKQSVEQAGKAIALLPDSTPGRELKIVIQDRTTQYYLAGGDETAAGDVLRELFGDVTPEQVATELGRRYAALCKSLIRRHRDTFPTGFEKWIARAVELAPRDELAWRLSAQLAYEKGELGKSVEDLRRALSLGADSEVVFAFVNLALSEHPEQADFQALATDLRAVVSPPDPASPNQTTAN